MMRSKKIDVDKIVPENYARTGLLGMLCSSAGPAIAVVSTNPFDVAKTRLQMQLELQRAQPNVPRVYSGPLDCLLKTFRSEGLRGVQRGLSICIVRDAVKSFFRIGLYSPLMSKVHPDGRAPFWKRMMAGGFCGGFSAAICNPLDLIKVRVQTTGGLNTVHHIAESGFSAFKNVVTESGARGLWRGASINVLRSTVGSSVLLSTVSKGKEVLGDSGVPDGMLRDAASSFFGSFIMTYVINPMDVARTRLYNQPSDPKTGRGLLYGSIIDTVAKIAKAEGPLGLFKGSVAHFLRVGPYCVLGFIFIGVFQRALRERKAREMVSGPVKLDRGV